MKAYDLSTWENIVYRVSRPLVIFGTSSFAEIANEYFSNDSIYDVVAFTVEKCHMKSDKFCGLPVVPFEELRSFYSPKLHFILSYRI